MARSQSEEITLSNLPVGPPPAGKGIGDGCVATQVAGNGRKLAYTWQHRMAGTWAASPPKRGNFTIRTDKVSGT